MTSGTTPSGLSFLTGTGEMTTLTRQFNWASTAVGSPAGWPQSLRTIVGVILNARFPMLLWWGPDLIQFYNDAYRPSLGINGKHPHALGQRGDVCWPEVWPTIKPMIDQVRAGGEATRTDDQLISIYRNDRIEDIYWTYGYSPVRDEAGQVAGVLVVCQETTRPVVALPAHDVTREKQGQQRSETSEADLRMLFEQVPVAIAILRGPELTCELANKHYLELVGRTDAGEVMGKPLLEALPELQGQEIDTLLRQVMRTGRAFTISERPIDRLRNGRLETGWFNFVCEPLRSTRFGEPAQRNAGMFIVAIEVTGPVLAKRKADQLLVGERELNELKSNFVTLASHEFRTPMGTILSSAALIGRYNGPDEADKRERHVQRIKSSINSLTGLLNDFLSLSRMEQATLHGSPQPLDIRLFCDEICEDMQGVIKPGQRVVYQHLSGPANISLDGPMFKNILVNLLVNASKYSADKKDIELTTAVPDGQLVVTVTDRGIGIPDTDKDKLFVNFFRARNAINVEGAGLELYVVKRYVDLLGGTVTFTSKLDSGTVFTVQLPVAELPV